MNNQELLNQPRKSRAEWFYKHEPEFNVWKHSLEAHKWCNQYLQKKGQPPKDKDRKKWGAMASSLEHMTTYERSKGSGNLPGITKKQAQNLHELFDLSLIHI